MWILRLQELFLLGKVIQPAITMSCVTPIALWWGWRAAFYFTGLVGAGWLVLWFFVSGRRDVREGPGRGAATVSQSIAPRWRDPRLWSFLAAYALGALPLAFVIYGAPIYLNRALGASQALIGKLLWIPPLGWEIGYFFWGWLADRAALGGRDRIVALARLMGVCLLLSLPLATTQWMPGLWMVMLELFLAMFVAGGFVILSITYATHVFSSDHAGLIAGLGAGAWSAVVALVMPVFGRCFDSAWWGTAFALAAVFPAAGHVCWWLVNRR